MKSPSIFVDTSAFIALQARDDAHHREAGGALPRLLSACRELVTSNLVVAETYTLLRMTKGFAVAWRFLGALEESLRMRLLHADEKADAEARELLKRFHDQDFSYTDAVSFALMKREGLSHAFTFDAHFSTAGFLRIPQDVPSL